MSLITETGYLETAYLSAFPYLTGQIENQFSMQVEMKVMNSNAIRSQVEMRIVDEDDDYHLGTQVEMRIVDENDDPHVGTQVEMKVFDSKAIGSQVDMFLNVFESLFTQVDMRIVDENDDRHLGSQVEMKILDSQSIQMQVEMVRMVRDALGSQVDMRIVDHLNALPMQVKIGFLAHYICGGYLDEIPYLTSPYLAARFCAHNFTQVDMNIGGAKEIGTQVEMRIIDENDDPHVGTQVEMRIKDHLKNVMTQVEMRLFDSKTVMMQVDQRIVDETDDPHVGTQVEMRIKDHLKNVMTQVNMLKSEKLFTQVTMVIYNRTQLRILCTFISRGIEALAGNNWVSIQAIAPGDYSPNNLNTDIIEQRTQTDGITALWQLRCNTGNPNSFVDTIGILNHNFSQGATVEVSGSDDPAFGTIKFTFPMTVEPVDMYYVSPTLPNIPAQYYQFTIQDAGNSAGFLSIGTIVFGSAIIMTKKEQFVNPVTYGLRHFKDTLETEGYTSVSNDRAIRKFLNLTYAQLIRTGGNFRALKSYILDAKTDHKCLVIPRPTIPSALAVFAKMSQLPEEIHNAIDDDNWRIDMTFDWDESL